MAVQQNNKCPNYRSAYFGLYSSTHNILDISQTIVQGYFNMMMIADTAKCEKDGGELAKELENLGKEIGVVIHCQHEDIFNMMHRI